MFFSISGKGFFAEVSTLIIGGEAFLGNLGRDDLKKDNIGYISNTLHLRKGVQFLMLQDKRIISTGVSTANMD